MGWSGWCDYNNPKRDYNPIWKGKFPIGSKVKATIDLSRVGGIKLGSIYTVLGYNGYGTVFLKELDYRVSGYGDYNFELVEDKMSNKELLDYAVDKIKLWDDRYTHTYAVIKQDTFIPALNGF